MSQENSRHRASERPEKLVEGFKVLPIAGPIFDKQEMVAVTLSPIFNPKMEAIIAEIIRKIM